MRIIRPAPGSLAARRPVAKTEPSPAPRSRRTAAGARWLDDQRRAARSTDQMILDGKIALARDRGLLARRRR